jgi:hypothetical protein
MLRKKKPKRNSGTRSKVSKRPWKCKAYRDYVKTLPCVVCGVWSVDAHHIRECFSRTMGRRISDVLVVPLCRAHHSDLHKHSRTFWKDVGMDPQVSCTAMFNRWQALSLRGEANP